MSLQCEHELFVLLDCHQYVSLTPPMLATTPLAGQLKRHDEPLPNNPLHDLARSRHGSYAHERHH